MEKARQRETVKIEGKKYSAYAFSEENNPNPQLFERVRRTTRKRITQVQIIENRRSIQ